MTDVFPGIESYLIKFYDFLPRLLAGAAVFLIAVLLSKWISGIVKRAMERGKQDQEIIILVQHITRWGILTMGTMLALDQISNNITSLIAGLGIIGFALGFALQDVAKNFIAGLLLLLQQPFDIGDAIEVGDYGGTVKNITLRVTEMVTWDGRNVQIPNADVYISPIINFSRSRDRRVALAIPVLQGADMELATSIASRTVKGLPGVLQEKTPVVIFSSLKSAEMQLEVYFWVDTSKADFLDSKGAAYKALLQAFNETGIAMPTSTLVVQMEKTGAG
ncbi:MAG: mechanosensitive ion channel [Anaerolineales bacterium]|nr:mechanosensitive ion channel [Anaerolineales bacterium]